MGPSVDAGKVGTDVGALVNVAVGDDFGRFVRGGRVGLDVCKGVGSRLPSRLNGREGAAVVGFGVGALEGAAVVG